MRDEPERCHATSRERMFSPTLRKTLQEPILMLPCVCFRGGGYAPLTPPKRARSVTAAVYFASPSELQTGAYFQKDVGVIILLRKFACGGDAEIDVSYTRAQVTDVGVLALAQCTKLRRAALDRTDVRTLWLLHHQPRGGRSGPA
jgi:hypothetical protein